MAKNKPEDYKAIMIWGKRLQSFLPYIKREQEKAAEENAPLDAIYQQGPGKWATVSGMQNATLKAEIEAELAEMRIPNKVRNRGTIARLAIQCTCPDSGETGCFLFTCESHRIPGTRCTPVMDQVELYRYADSHGWKEVSRSERPEGSIAAYLFEP